MKRSRTYGSCRCHRETSAPTLPSPQAGRDRGAHLGFSWEPSRPQLRGRQPKKIVRLALYAPLYAINAMACAHGRLSGFCSPAGDAGCIPAGHARRRDPAMGRRSADRRRLRLSRGRVAALVFGRSRRSIRVPHPGCRPVRCPNGPLADIARIAEGQPLYDPAKLTMPTLLVRGDDDTTSTHSAAVRLLGEIASPQKQYCVVARGSNFLCIERNRAKLYEHLNDFFAQIRPGEMRA